MTDAMPINAVEIPTTEPEKKPDKHWLFSGLRAKELSVKAVEARRLKKLNPQPPSNDEPILHQNDRVSEDDGFIVETLMCVRERITKALKDMSKESDAGKLDKLASTISRLEVVEQKLSGRASPGSLRPRQEKPRKQSQIEPEL